MQKKLFSLPHNKEHFHFHSPQGALSYRRPISPSPAQRSCRRYSHQRFWRSSVKIGRIIMCSSNFVPMIFRIVNIIINIWFWRPTRIIIMITTRLPASSLLEFHLTGHERREEILPCWLHLDLKVKITLIK